MLDTRVSPPIETAAMIVSCSLRTATEEQAGSRSANIPSVNVDVSHHARSQTILYHLLLVQSSRARQLLHRSVSTREDENLVREVVSASMSSLGRHHNALYTD